MNVADINYVAMVVSSIVNVIIGMVWFSPQVFGGMRSRLMKGSDKNMPMNGQKKTAYVAYFLTSLISAYILSSFVDFAGARTVFEGAMVGGWLWLGFVATFSFARVIWEGVNIDFWAINNGYYLLTLAVQGAILAQWL